MTDKKKKQEEKSVLQLISEQLDEIADAAIWCEVATNTDAICTIPDMVDDIKSIIKKEELREREKHHHFWQSVK